MEVQTVAGLLALIVIGFILMSISGQFNSVVSTPLFFGGIAFVIVGGIAVYKTIFD